MKGVAAIREIERTLGTCLKNGKEDLDLVAVESTL